MAESSGMNLVRLSYFGISVIELHSEIPSNLGIFLYVYSVLGVGKFSWTKLPLRWQPMKFQYH